jgi:alkylhydroperoxidase family enzyme
MVGGGSFLGEPPAGDGAASLYAEDRESDGYVWNVTRLWSWRPDLADEFAGIRSRLMESSALEHRDFAVLVAATAGALGDSYCSLAWGQKLAAASDAETAAGVISGELPERLSERERALAGWARMVVRDPNGTSAADVGRLRDVGLSDREIFEATLFVGLRLAFSSVNDALGAAPDRQLVDAVPDAVRAAVSFGRPAAAKPSAA